MRVAYAFHHTVDSDEPQHLHMAWGWTHGLLPYRDVFDNHAPLFAALSAPIVGVLGERPDIILPLRLAMMPLVALALWSSWMIARQLFSSRVALWAVALAGFYPSFLSTSVEYRADDLWMASWLLALAILLGGRVVRKRSWTAGFMLGVTLCVSAKTILLLASLAGAACATAWQSHRRGVTLPVRRCGAWLVGGFAIVPALVAAFFWASGAWAPFVYCIAAHNVVPGLGLWRWQPLRPLVFPVALPLLWWIATHLMSGAPSPYSGARRTFVFLTAGFYLAGLEAFWPLITRQDFLPLVPLAAVMLAPLLLEVPTAIARRVSGAGTRGLPSWSAAALLLGIELAALIASEPPWRDGTRLQTRLISDTLRLTRPGDYLMDLKGETVFRRRPYYFALEGVTKDRMANGLIRDDIADRLMSTRTAVVAEDSPEFPPSARAFMDSNYVSVGSLRALGRILNAAPDPPGDPQRFEIRIPERYAVMSERGSAAGILDGVPYRHARDLAVGAHVYRPALSEARVAVVWASAVERGFSPFSTEGAAR